MRRVMEGPFMTRSTVLKGEIETCDSCGRIIIGRGEHFTEDMFVTEHGLLCGECTCRMKSGKIVQDDNTIWTENR